MEKVKELCKKIKASKLLKAEIIVILVCWILGTLLHFVYEWTGENVIIASFSAVNESVWEHLKLIYFPMLITAVIGSFFFEGKQSNYLCIKTKAILLAMAFVVVFFYTYTGIIGTNFAILDIGSFVVAIILSSYYTYQKVQMSVSCNYLLAILILFILFLCFVLFTFFPPHIELFQDPITLTFGL